MARSQIAVNAVAVGLCALMPVPFLDDVLRRVLMRGLYQAIADRQAVPLDGVALRALTRAPPLRLLGCVGALVLYPLRKLSRKVLYLFAVKDALDWTAEAAVRGELVQIALRRGLLPERAVEVRAAMDTAWDHSGGSPLTRTLLRRENPPLDWSRSEGAMVPLVGALARRGAAARVIEAFAAELDRVEAAPDAGADAAPADASADPEPNPGGAGPGEPEPAPSRHPEGV